MAAGGTPAPTEAPGGEGAGGGAEGGAAALGELVQTPAPTPSASPDEFGTVADGLSANPSAQHAARATSARAGTSSTLLAVQVRS